MDKRVIEVANEIAKYQEELEYLASFKFDNELFNLRRNYILGTAIVDEIRLKMGESPIIWERGYSQELIPQHWLFYCMQGLEVKFNHIYIETLNKFPEMVHWNEMKNQSPHVRVEIDMMDQELFELVKSIYNQILTTMIKRLEPNQRVSAMFNDLNTSHRKKQIKVQTLLDTAKKEAADLLNKYSGLK